MNKEERNQAIAQIQQDVEFIKKSIKQIQESNETIKRDISWIIQHLLNQNKPFQPPPYIPTEPYVPTWPPLGPAPVIGKSCPKCGISLDGVMGYVCGDANCPTFLKVTC